jgi:hypothetical protein
MPHGVVRSAAASAWPLDRPGLPRLRLPSVSGSKRGSAWAHSGVTGCDGDSAAASVRLRAASDPAASEPPGARPSVRLARRV